MRARGVTLLETAVALAIVGVLSAMALTLAVDAGAKVDESIVGTDARLRAARIAESIAREVRGARIVRLGGSAISPVDSFTAIDFRRVEGWSIATGQPTLGRLHQIRFAYHGSEAGTGGRGDLRDNDRDGLVDEGDLWLCRDADGDGAIQWPNERVSIIAGNVTNNFSAQVASRGSVPAATDLYVELVVQIQARTGYEDRSHGRIYRASIARRIALRN